ncbi:MAG: hypothetical protein WD845_09315 [Pirellulales bacterium]
MRRARAILLAVALMQAAALADEPPAESPAQDATGFAARAAKYVAAGEHKLAIAEYDKLLQLNPRQAETYDLRGSQHFMLGHVDESIADFDQYLKLRPDQEPWHWKRGISFYYAGRYDDGRRQFEGYQTVDDSDVENAVWRYLCMARDRGVDVARDGLLKIKQDRRVPMSEVYALYAGKAQPVDVLQAARAGAPSTEELNARLFYAHLYLGLYYEVAGDKPRALEHLMTAADKHKIGHYMWHVANVHARRLKADTKQ